MNIQFCMIKAFLLFACTQSTILFALGDGAVFQTITTDGTIKNTLWYNLDGQKQSVYANNILRSPDYAYEQRDSILFYGDRYDSEGNPIPEAIASLPLQENPKRLLLVFSKIEDIDRQGLSYHITVLPDDFDQFPMGSFKFINVSDSRIAVDLDGNQFVLNQRDSNTLNITANKKGAVSIKVASQGIDGMWQTNYANGWSHRSDRRTLVFIVNKGSGNVRPIRFRQTHVASDG